VAEIVLGIGTSHSPLLLLPAAEWVDRANDDKLNEKLNLSDGRFLTYDALRTEAKDKYADRATPATFSDQCGQCRQALDRLADEIAVANPDVVVIVGDDQEELFDLRSMPAFAIFCGEEIVTRPLESMHYIPRWLADSPAGAGYAMDTVRRYAGAPAFGRFTIEHLMDEGIDVAAVSAVQNPGTQGLGIGQALRRVIDSYPEKLRVAVVASGGLSHFVCDEELDGRVLRAICAGETTVLQALPRASLNSGSSEIANWICVSGVMQGRGCKWSDYVPVHRTPAGTGIGLSFLTWK
jgi:hypothetical protein